MAHKTFRAEPPPAEPAVDMAAFGRELQRRREALGNPDLPRNGGARRTPSKRVLLKALKEAGGEW